MKALGRNASFHAWRMPSEKRSAKRWLFLASFQARCNALFFRIAVSRARSCSTVPSLARIALRMALCRILVAFATCGGNLGRLLPPPPPHVPAAEHTVKEED